MITNGLQSRGRGEFSGTVKRPNNAVRQMVADCLLPGVDWGSNSKIGLN
jgi:hypothetical protein